MSSLPRAVIGDHAERVGGAYLLWVADDCEGSDRPLEELWEVLPEGWAADWTGETRLAEGGAESRVRVWRPERGTHNVRGELIRWAEIAAEFTRP